MLYFFNVYIFHLSFLVNFIKDYIKDYEIYYKFVRIINLKVYCQAFNTCK